MACRRKRRELQKAEIEAIADAAEAEELMLGPVELYFESKSMDEVSEDERHRVRGVLGGLFSKTGLTDICLTGRTIREGLLLTSQAARVSSFKRSAGMAAVAMARCKSCSGAMYTTARGKDVGH